MSLQTAIPYLDRGIPQFKLFITTFKLLTSKLLEGLCPNRLETMLID